MKLYRGTCLLRVCGVVLTCLLGPVAASGEELHAQFTNVDGLEIRIQLDAIAQSTQVTLIDVNLVPTPMVGFALLTPDFLGITAELTFGLELSEPIVIHTSVGNPPSDLWLTVEEYGFITILPRPIVLNSTVGSFRSVPGEVYASGKLQIGANESEWFIRNVTLPGCLPCEDTRFGTSFKVEYEPDQLVLVDAFGTSLFFPDVHDERFAHPDISASISIEPKADLLTYLSLVPEPSWPLMQVATVVVLLALRRRTVHEKT